MRSWRPEFGWLAVAGFVLLLGIWWLPGPETLSSDSFSVTHGGKKAFFKLLRAFEAETGREQEQLAAPQRSIGTLLVLGPARYPTDNEWAALAGEVADGMTLVFAAPAFGPTDLDLTPFGVKVEFPEKQRRHAEKTDQTAEDDTEDQQAEANSEHAANAGQQAADEFLARLRRRGQPATTDLIPDPVNWIGSGHLKIERSQVDVLLTVANQPRVARFVYGNGMVIVSSSDEIFSNAAMLDPRRATLAYRLVEQVGLQTPIVFDESLNGSGVPKVFGTLFTPALRPITLQLLLLLVLFGWAGSQRFGPAAPSIDKPRRSIVEHAEALGSLYYRSRAGALVLSRWLENLTWELKLGSKGTLQPRDVEMLARSSQTSVDEVRDLMKSAAQEIHHPQANNAVVARLIQRLAEVRARISRRR